MNIDLESVDSSIGMMTIQLIATEFGTGKKFEHLLGNLDLAGMWLELMNKGMERLIGPSQSLDKERVSSHSDSQELKAMVRIWLREEKIKPWRYHSWQKSTDPDFVPKAGPVLDLYETAQADADAGILSVCTDEKTSVQSRQRVDETLPAIETHPVRVADRYKRMGAIHLFCALAVASGMTFAKTFARKCFAQFKAFLLVLFASTLCKGIKVLNLILDNGSTRAPKQLGNWIASLKLIFEVRNFWLPKYASWLDQVRSSSVKCNATCSIPMIFQAPRP